MLPTRSFLPLAALALVASCSLGDMTAGREEAQKAVEVFHERLDAGRFGDIYDGADDEFRGTTDRQHLLDLLGAVTRKLGKVTETTNTGWRVNSRNFRTYVELSQRTRFERGQARESFVFFVRKGKASLLRYDISSDELILR